MYLDSKAPGQINNFLTKLSTADTFEKALKDVYGYNDEQAFITEYKANGAAFMNGLVTSNFAGTSLVANNTGYYATQTAVDENSTLKFKYNFDVGTAGSIIFHIGANEGQNVTIDLPFVSSSGLGVDEVDLTSQRSADSAIESFDGAIKSLSLQRSNLGAYKNRLEYTINSLGYASENLTAAESRIRDTDVANEMMNFTKQNILMQAAQSMLAQANQLPQGILQLLG